MPTKFKTSILIFGIIVMCLLACLATFLVLAFSGVLVTERIPVEITVQAATKVYDGTPLTAYEYRIEGELAEGHKESVTFTDSLTDAGESLSGADVRILDEDGYDVTSQYKIKVNEGLLRVTRQSLSVAIGDTEVVYSGERIIFDDYILRSGTLAKGHKIGAESAVGVIQPGVVESKYLTPAVYDAFGNDVTANYNIAFAQGTVQITARPLVVRPKSLTKEYDGKALLPEGIEIVSGSLIAGHYIRATEFQTGNGDTAAQLTEVGKLPIYIRSYSIYDAKGENVSDYYKVTNEIGDPGVLEVTPRELTVVGKSKEWEYDGNAHYLTSVAGRDDYETSAEMTIGLAEGHTVVVNYDSLRNSDGTVTNRIVGVGKTPCVINSDNVTIVDGLNIDKSQNYHVTYINGTLTVTPQTVRITVKDYTVEYNEEAISEETLRSQLVLFDPFRPEDFELVMSDEEYKNAGVYSLSAKPYVDDDPQTADEIEAEAFRKELFRNYQIDVVPGTVTIAKKTIDITVGSFSREYTGEEISDETILNNVSFRGSFDKSSFEIDKDVEKIVDAGQYRISVKFKEGSEPTDDFDSDNYKLSINAGTLTVTPKKVGVMVLSSSVEYSGSKVSEAELQKLIVCGDGFLPSDFRIDADENGFVNVGTYVLDAKVKTDAITSAKLKNYEPNVTPGTLTITKKKVLVRVKNAEKEYTTEANAYDGTLQSMLVCGDTALAESAEKRNAMLSPVIDSDYGNAGSYTVSAALRDNVEENVKTNIELDVVVGIFTIVPKTITADLGNENTSPFTGNPIALDDIPTPAVEGVTGLSIVSSSLVGAKNAGEYTFTADMVVRTEAGEISPNYNVIVQAGVWTITPAEVEIITGAPLSLAYNGKIEIKCGALQLSFPDGLSQDLKPDNYSVISVEYDADEADLFEAGSGTVNVTGARIRDNVLGQECFNFIATGEVSVTIETESRKLAISIGSVTLKEGQQNIGNLLAEGGVDYNLTGLADGDIVSYIEFDVANSIIEYSTITILNQDGVDVTKYYDDSQLYEVAGNILYI